MLRKIMSKISKGRYKKTKIFIKKIILNIQGKKYPSHFKLLPPNLVEINDIENLKKIFRWGNTPILDDPIIYGVESNVDKNNRRVIDAQILGTIMCNVKPKVALEIGTATGHGTALMAINSPKSHIFTLNILPEDIVSGEGGNLVTEAFGKEKIGEYYRELKLQNISQIYANTATWEPDIGNIDIAFIDGCHDTEFVYNDTVKVLRHMKPGSFIIWHDFNMDQVMIHEWINSVCKGVEKLFEKGYLKGQVFHVKNSWMGIYRIP